MRKKGQIFTIDLLLALVPLAIIMGVSANAMSGVITQVQDYAHIYSMTRVANEAADVLVKTAGDPVIWNSTSPPTVIGLAKYEDNVTVPHFLDDSKVGVMTSLSTSYLTDLIGPGFSYYNLSITGITETFDLSWGGGSESSASDIVEVRRVARLEIGKLMGGFWEVGHKGSEATEPCFGEEGQPRVYTSTFSVTAAELTAYDFWIARYADDTGLRDWYDISPDDPNVECTTGGNAPDTQIGSGGAIVVKVQIDDGGPGDGEWLTAGSNTVYLRIAGRSATHADYYILRVPAGTAEASVAASLAKPNPVMVTLEVGK